MPTSPSSFNKQPYEEYTIKVEFKKQMDSTELITDSTVLATLTSEGDSTSLIIAGTMNYSNYVNVGVKGGVDGVAYKISTRIVTDKQLPDGTYNKFESDVTLSIIEE
jgi:hypothetical protein